MIFFMYIYIHNKDHIILVLYYYLEIYIGHLLWFILSRIINLYFKIMLNINNELILIYMTMNLPCIASIKYFKIYIFIYIYIYLMVKYILVID